MQIAEKIKLLIFFNIIMLIVASESPYGCARPGYYGCYKNLCWSECSGAFRRFQEWCYTTKAASTLSGEYVACKNDSECEPCWRCAGSCTCSPQNSVTSTTISSVYPYFIYGRSVAEKFYKHHYPDVPKKFNDLGEQNRQSNSDKTFKCDRCPYETKYHSNLKSHKNAIHEGIKRLKCDECEYKSSTNSHVKRHKLSIHKSWGVKFSQLRLYDVDEQRTIFGRYVNNSGRVFGHPSIRTKFGSTRLSPNLLGTSSSSRDFYGQSTGDEENLEPNILGLNPTFSRLSPSSLASPQTAEYYNQNEENLEPRILSPYSGNGDSEEGGTIYAASPETFSGSLYYKQEITETGDIMDVVSWWEQEQGRLVHHSQPQRLAHV